VFFEALIDNEAGEEFHRNHGQLGYALKDRAAGEEAKEGLNRAYEELSKAIELRDQQGVQGFLMYEFNHALCAIKLGKEPEVIQHDLQAAAGVQSIWEKFEESEIIVAWAKQNQYHS